MSSSISTTSVSRFREGQRSGRAAVPPGCPETARQLQSASRAVPLCFSVYARVPSGRHTQGRLEFGAVRGLLAAGIRVYISQDSETSRRHHSLRSAASLATFAVVFATTMRRSTCQTMAMRRGGFRGRRQGRGLVAHTATKDATTSTGVGQRYINVTGFPFPLGPLFERRTKRTRVGDGMWTFEQEQSLANIAVNVRMTAIRLECGGLWIHNPIAPTAECEALLRELDCPVRYIVLGTAAYEHKIFVGPFSRRWPDAKVYITPQQWSWPLFLPSQLFGIFPTGELKDQDENSPWAKEIEQRLLCPKERLGFGFGAAECAFFHRRSKTLLCTDALVFVPEDPPDIINSQELISLGRNTNNVVLDLVGAVNWRGSGQLMSKMRDAEASSSARGELDLMRTGWQRDVLFALFVGPDGDSIVEPAQAFRAIAGRWIIGPVVYSLVYTSAKIRQDVCKWGDAMCEWDIQQILPAHFAGPVRGSADDIRRAFEVLQQNVDANTEPGFSLPWPFPQPVRYRAKDIQLLQDLGGALRVLGII